MALYDALYRIGIRLFVEAEAALWQTTAPDWDRIEAWFTQRLALAEAHPDLYHLVFDVPIPGFVPSPESLGFLAEIDQATAARDEGEHQQFRRRRMDPVAKEQSSKGAKEAKEYS